MFEIGFSEMLLIGVVALVVLGPERLPKAARFVGLWVRRVRAYWFNMRAELERELAAEEMKKHLDEARAALHEAEQRMVATTGEASAALSVPAPTASPTLPPADEANTAPAQASHPLADAATSTPAMTPVPPGIKTPSTADPPPGPPAP